MALRSRHHLVPLRARYDRCSEHEFSTSTAVFQSQTSDAYYSHTVCPPLPRLSMHTARDLPCLPELRQVADALDLL
jgi:hypothetical protein